MIVWVPDWTGTTATVAPSWITIGLGEDCADG
ncbi:MAG: hypothetical protein JWM19_4818, partial [Actinomycetia bacterium]|nr:hypothetical protein [Actinomycetes bacterium]